MMGKALSGELSCSCDRSCCNYSKIQKVVLNMWQSKMANNADPDQTAALLYPNFLHVCVGKTVVLLTSDRGVAQNEGLESCAGGKTLC